MWQGFNLIPEETRERPPLSLSTRLFLVSSSQGTGPDNMLFLFSVARKGGEEGSTTWFLDNKQYFFCIISLEMPQILFYTEMMRYL